MVFRDYVKKYFTPFLITSLVSLPLSFDRTEAQRIEPYVDSVLYSSGQTSPDFDGDGLVDFSDFVKFAGAFGTNNDRYDLTGDGKVDFLDFVEFAKYFGTNLNGNSSEQSVNLSGILEDNENHGGQQGIVRIYSSKDSTFLGEVSTDKFGRFNGQIEYQLSDLNSIDSILVQARKVEDGKPLSYVRSVRLLVEGQSDLVLRVVPYDGEFLLDFDRNGTFTSGETFKFKEYMGEIGAYVSPIIRRWHFKEDDGRVSSSYGNPVLFRGFRMLRKNTPENSINGSGEFSQNDFDFIRSKISDREDIGAMVPGANLERYPVEFLDRINVDERGWIYFIPDSTLAERMGADGFTSGGIFANTIDLSKIWIDTKRGMNHTVISHELFHAFVATSYKPWPPMGLAGGHTTVFLPHESLINSNPYRSILKPFKVPDVKAAFIVYEPSFFNRIYPYGVSLEDVLGMDFIAEK